jgi:hypothetical protein
MSQPVIITTNTVINGHTIPALDWTCHLTSYGNLCTFELRLATAKVKQLGYDIFSDQRNNPNMECQIILNNVTTGPGGILFDGIVDTIEGTWEDDILEICGRDYSALLRDQTATLDQYINQKVSDVVTGIANTYNLQSNVSSSSIIAGVRASTFQGENWAFTKSPRPLWHIIQNLADEAGYVVFVDQHKVLNFVPPGQGKNNWTYYWRSQPSSQQQQDHSLNPILKLRMMQQSRRCNNFTLRLHGYDADQKQTIYYEKVVGTGQGKIISVNRQDLNSQNYIDVANNIAAAIERKNIVAKVVVNGNYNFNLNDNFQIMESESNDLLGMSGQQLYIASIVHQFSMPEFGSHVGDGFLTHLTLNQTGSSVS